MLPKRSRFLIPSPIPSALDYGVRARYVDPVTGDVHLPWRIRAAPYLAGFAFFFACVWLALRGLDVRVVLAASVAAGAMVGWWLPVLRGARAFERARDRYQRFGPQAPPVAPLGARLRHALRRLALLGPDATQEERRRARRTFATSLPFTAAVTGLLAAVILRTWRRDFEYVQASARRALVTIAAEEQLRASLPPGTHAICRDGWASTSSGRGTCSWHGGVAHYAGLWLDYRAIRADHERTSRQRWPDVDAGSIAGLTLAWGGVAVAWAWGAARLQWRQSRQAIGTDGAGA